VNQSVGGGAGVVVVVVAAGGVSGMQLKRKENCIFVRF
jgi:hypothetical protein